MIHSGIYFAFCLLLCISSCTRPLAVTHWDAKGIALINKSIASKKKNGHGYPKHNQLSRIVCFNKNCINKAENTNIREKYRFKPYKNNDPIRRQPAQDVEKNEPVVARQQEKKETPAEVKFNTIHTFQHVYFETGKASLNKGSLEELDQLVQVLQQDTSLTITVSGHTDNAGDESTNLTLSQDRANAVINYFEAQGIVKQRLNAKGFGSTQPVAANNIEEGRNKNRRVEFIITQK